MTATTTAAIKNATDAELWHFILNFFPDAPNGNPSKREEAREFRAAIKKEFSSRKVKLRAII